MIAGVLVAVATEPVKPFADTTDTLDTVPAPPVAALITPPEIVIVVPSTFTPPRTDVEAVGSV